jgi:hypothetical protein
MKWPRRVADDDRKAPRAPHRQRDALLFARRRDEFVPPITLRIKQRSEIAVIDAGVSDVA